MVNTLKLKAAITEAGYTQSTLANELKISPTTLSLKVIGKAKFDIDEATKICQILGIADGEKRADIFLHQPSLKGDKA